MMMTIMMMVMMIMIHDDGDDGDDGEEDVLCSETISLQCTRTSYHQPITVLPQRGDA